jgi:hypothetical protein
MKTINLLTLTVVTGSLLTLTARAGIVGSPHDLSGYSWNTDPSDPGAVCTVCHTPHHADNTIVPLWGHQTTAQTFKMYNTTTVPISQMVAVPAASPNGPSLACLSCHDGLTAVNVYGGSPTYGAAAWSPQGPGQAAQYLTNSAVIGTDLTHSHPISFTYDSILASPTKDPWLNNPDTAQVLTPASGNFTPGNSLLINNFLLNGNHTVECTSCHDVHNDLGTPYGPNNLHLVKIVGRDANGVGSLLCRSCHNK